MTQEIRVEVRRHWNIAPYFLVDDVVATARFVQAAGLKAE